MQQRYLEVMNTHEYVNIVNNSKYLIIIWLTWVNAWELWRNVLNSYMSSICVLNLLGQNIACIEERLHYLNCVDYGWRESELWLTKGKWFDRADITFTTSSCLVSCCQPLPSWSSVFHQTRAKRSLSALQSSSLSLSSCLPSMSKSPIWSSFSSVLYNI